jgi:ubiquinone biosynthesis protein
LSTSQKTLARVAQTVAVFVRYRIIFAALPWRRSSLDPVQLRLAFEYLGGSWIKLGQMLATRFDLLPASFCHELFKLLNEVKPFPYEQVREVIKQELGGYPEEVFLQFDPTPFAAASIGQVHRAVLPSGHPVAVKVQRPDARQVFAADIQIMYAVSSLLNWVGLFGTTGSKQVIDEFARWTDDELDYLVEARQGVRLRDNAAGDPLQHIARVWGPFTTTRVLTLDLVNGIPLIEIVNAVRVGDSDYLDQLRADGHDLHRIVRHIDWNMLNQIHAYGFFHADLHPANLFVLPGDAIGYVDFGIVGKLSGDMRRSLTRYSWLLFQGETDRAMAELMRWVAPASVSRVETARNELVRVHEEFIITVSAAGRITTKGAGMAFAAGILDIVRRHGIVLSPNVIAYLRTLISADGLRFELAPEYNLPWHVQRFFGRLIAKEAKGSIQPQQAVLSAYDTTLRVNRILDAADAQLLMVSNVEARIRNLQNRVKGASKWLLTLAILLIVGVLLLHFLDLNPDARTDGPIPDSGRRWVHWVVFAVIIFLVFAIVGQVRRLMGAERASADSPDD